MKLSTFRMLSWACVSFLWTCGIFKVQSHFCGLSFFFMRLPPVSQWISYLWFPWWGRCFLFGLDFAPPSAIPTPLARAPACFSLLLNYLNWPPLMGWKIRPKPIYPVCDLNLDHGFHSYILSAYYFWTFILQKRSPPPCRICIFIQFFYLLEFDVNQIPVRWIPQTPQDTYQGPIGGVFF